MRHFASHDRLRLAAARRRRRDPAHRVAFFRFVRDHPDTLEHLPPYIHEAIVRTYISNASHRGLTASDLDQLAVPWLTDDGRSAFYRQIAQYDEQYLVENERRIGELDLPVRVVWGADDGWIPVQTGRRLADLIPGADLVEVPGAGHLIQYDVPSRSPI